MGALKKIAKVTINILITIVFIILVLIIVAKVSMLANNKSYFEAFGYSFFNVATGSMEPAISQNDIIVVEKTDEFAVGDIVTFEKDGNFITHRIVLITGDLITTKGDANNTSDVSIKKDLIIGKVTKIYSHAGIWQKIFTTPQIIVAIFVTLILFDFAFSYKGNKKIPVEEEVEEEKIKVEKVEKLENKDELMTSIKQIQEELKDIKNNKISNDTIKEKSSKRKKLITTEFSDEDTVRLYKKIKKIKEEKSSKDVEDDYTIRLDLTGMQKELEKNLKKEE